MENEEILQKLKAISNKDVGTFNEENVKVKVVLKILETLGHSSDDLDLEHSFHSDRPDIIVKGFEQPTIIEVKGANENLTKHIPQIKRYSDNTRSLLSVLTNGNLFYVFSPFWKRKSFEETLILSFELKDLGNEELAENVASLFNKDLGYKRILKNIEQMENEILNKEEEINEKEIKISSLKNKARLLEEKYPKIEELIKFIDHLKPETQLEIESYLDSKKQINDLEEEIRSLRDRLPRLNKLGETPEMRPPIRPPLTLEKEDFSMGISDEVINIKALQNGIQIILCKRHEKTNQYIFLIQKTSYRSDYEPSERGKQLMKDSIDKDTTKHVAKIEYLPIPGKNKKFWQELYNEKEFDIWNPDQPYKYFSRSGKSKMLLWILRVFEMPFEIRIGKDFSRESMGNAKISNSETLKRIQSGFDKGEFKPVLEDHEFERRKKKIMEIARKYS